MAGANLERTSYTTDEVGAASVAWYRPIEPYIITHIQLILANNRVYVATAAGLYSYDAADGSDEQVFPTELPLGHSPTVVGDTVYFGGLDGRMYARYTSDLSKKWTFTDTRAGFYVNPLVVDGVVYAGNRDGTMYAIDASDGTLKWKYKTNGPILFSAAYKDNTIYFGSNDSYAYALKTNTTNLDGELVWKTKLPTGNGFHSFWPVIKDDVVIFRGDRPYRENYVPGLPGFPDANGPTKGDDTTLGPSLGGGYIDMSPALLYFTQKPWRRTVYVLNRQTGGEITPYAPILYYGTNNGPGYPVGIGPDNRIYSTNWVDDTNWRGDVVGWELGSDRIFYNSPLGNPNNQYALDEPEAFTIGGRTIYKSIIDDRVGSARNIDSGDFTQYWAYGDSIDGQAPGYSVRVKGGNDGLSGITKVFGSNNGIYGYNGNNQNPLIPYEGRLYTHKSNAILCLSPSGGGSSRPMALVLSPGPEGEAKKAEVSLLQTCLAEEIQKMISAGHLRTGYKNCSFDNELGYITDYFHDPAETIYVLSRVALCESCIPEELRAQLKTYIQTEFANYSPLDFEHIGYQTGASRDDTDYPDEIVKWMAIIPAQKGMLSNYPKGSESWFWDRNPFMFYALWNYAKVFGGAAALFNEVKTQLDIPCPVYEAVFRRYDSLLNAWIAGYIGFVKLGELAIGEGCPDCSAIIDQARNELENKLLPLRVTIFDKNTRFASPEDAYSGGQEQALAVANNFLWMTPELGQYLRDHAWDQINEAYQEYKDIAPYWFVTNFEATWNEKTLHHLLDYNAIFALKAMILQEGRDELSKYIDVPAFTRGDLYHILNLVLAIEAGPAVPPPDEYGGVSEDGGISEESGISGDSDILGDSGGGRDFSDDGGVGGDGSDLSDGGVTDDSGNPMSEKPGAIQGGCGCAFSSDGSVKDLWGGAGIVLLGFWVFRKRRRGSSAFGKPHPH